MSDDKEKQLQKVSDARQVLSQGVEIAQNLHDADDQLTALKTGYKTALTYVPDNIKRTHKLYLLDMDDYMDSLNYKRSLNLYEMQKKKTQARIDRDKVLHKRQEALISFQKYCLIHGRIYQDNIVIIDDNFRVIRITVDQFYSYIKPYQDFLQTEFKRLRPDMKK